MLKVKQYWQSIDWMDVALAYGVALALVLGTLFVIGIARSLITAPTVTAQPLSVEFLSSSEGRDLTGLQILDTDQITCGEDSHASITWFNETDSPIYITKAQVWMGMYKGSISDFAVWVQRNERPSALMHSNWDHYADPVGPDHYIQMDYSPHHITVKPRESISLNTFCSNLEDSNAVGHAVLTIWYYQ